MNKELLIKHLEVLYDGYKGNYSIDKSLYPSPPFVNRFRDAAAEVKVLITQIRQHLPDAEMKKVDITFKV